MRSLRRILRRKQKRFFALSLLSLTNFIFPQHVQAAPIHSEPAIVVQTITQAVTVAPSTEPINRQTLPAIPTIQAKRTVNITATAYTSSRDETDGSPDITASGAHTRDGIIAANGLKFGTRVRFPDQYGDKIFVVQDRMNSRYGSSYVDIWMTTKTVAKQWGVRHVRMEIL